MLPERNKSRAEKEILSSFSGVEGGVWEGGHEECAGQAGVKRREFCSGSRMERV